MKSITRIFKYSLFLCCIIAIGCGHTNKLAQYNLRSQRVALRAHSATVGGATSDIVSGSRNLLGDITASLGSGAISNNTAEKLNRAANADSLAMRIARGFNEAAISYLSVIPTKRESESDYIAETLLQSYNLSSDSTGINAHIQALSRIIQRSTGTIVWEYGTSRNIALASTSSTNANGRAIMSAVNAATLASMSESEIAEVFNGAALEMGHDIGETLREDVADLAKH